MSGSFARRRNAITECTSTPKLFRPRFSSLYQPGVENSASRRAFKAPQQQPLSDLPAAAQRRAEREIEVFQPLIFRRFAPPYLTSAREVLPPLPPALPSCQLVPLSLVYPRKVERKAPFQRSKAILTAFKLFVFSSFCFASCIRHLLGTVWV